MKIVEIIADELNDTTNLKFMVVEKGQTKVAISKYLTDNRTNHAYWHIESDPQEGKVTAKMVRQYYWTNDKTGLTGLSTGEAFELTLELADPELISKIANHFTLHPPL